MGSGRGNQYCALVPQLRVALAQLNVTVGDIDGNADRIVAWTRNAVERGAHVVAFPELGLTGYPVEDLALRASFVDASQAGIKKLAQRLADEGLGDIVVICGYLDRASGTAMGIDRLGRPKGSPTNLGVAPDGITFKGYMA